MWKRLSKVIVSRSNRPHGTNPRFQCADHSRAPGAKRAADVLAAISGKAGNTDIAVSVVTLIELAHGAARADTSQRKQKRQQFIQELLTALPMHPVTVSLALRVGQIDGENQAKGIRLPLSDLLIGVTALELGYSVATGNLRHFQMIPGLSVVQF